MNSFQTAKLITINFIFILLLTSCISKKNIPNNSEVNNLDVNNVDVNILLKSTYLPEKKDIPLILSNSITGHYFSKNDDCGIILKKIVSQEFGDSLLTIKKPSTMVTTYNNNVLIKSEMLQNGKSVHAIECYRNLEGILFKKIILTNDLQSGKYEYRYEKDRIYEIYIENNFIINYNTYFLNEKKQCIRKVSQLPDHEIRSDSKYFYDYKGRVIKETYSSYEKIYTYLDESLYNYSTSKLYDLETNQLFASSESLKDGNKRILITKNSENKIVSKIITITDSKCNEKMYSYNDKNELTYISLTTVE